MDTDLELAASEREVCFDATSQQLTCNDQNALKVFNEALTEYVLLRKNFFVLFERALLMDRERLVIIHSALVIIRLIDLKAPDHPDVSPHLAVISKAVIQDDWCEREMAYMRAALALAHGDSVAATDHLCTMLLNHPGDIFALRLCADIFGARGEHHKSRDACARAMPFWEKKMPLYCGFLANYGFALEESKERERGEELCRRALDLENRLPFAIHGLAHVYEETRSPSDGIQFLSSTRSDWEGLFAGHITWHLTLMYLDAGDYDNMFKEFDAVLKQRLGTKNNVKPVFDASSLLWRLEVMGIPVGEERWATVTEAVKHHLDNHRSPWFSAHLMFSLVRGDVTESVARLTLAKEMIMSIEESMTRDCTPFHNISEKLGLPVCKALLAYGEKRYNEVVQILLPLRHDFHWFGGSWAQRQVFDTTLIFATVRDNNIPLAIGLVAEMIGHKPNNKTYRELLDKLLMQRRSLSN